MSEIKRFYTKGYTKGYGNNYENIFKKKEELRYEKCNDCEVRFRDTDSSCESPCDTCTEEVNDRSCVDCKHSYRSSVDKNLNSYLICKIKTDNAGYCDNPCNKYEVENGTN